MGQVLETHIQELWFPRDRMGECTHYGFGWNDHSPFIIGTQHIHSSLTHEAIYQQADPQKGDFQLPGKKLLNMMNNGGVHLWVSRGALEFPGVCLEWRLGEIPSSMTTICILHNICKARGESFLKTGTAPGDPHQQKSLVLWMVSGMEQHSQLTVPEQNHHQGILIRKILGDLYSAYDMITPKSLYTILQT